MKQNSRLSTKQLLFGLAFLLAFLGLTLFLFTYQRDEKRFESLTNRLFTEELEADTLDLHYTLANPADFGIHDYVPSLSCYSAESIPGSRAATENMLAALNALDADKLSPADARLWQLLTRSLENSLGLSGFLYYDEPLSPASGTQTQLPILLAEYAFRSRRDVEDYLALLDQTDEYFASLLAYEQEKAAAGFPMPAAFLQDVRKQCDTIVTLQTLEVGTHFLQTTFQERLEELFARGLVTAEEAGHYTAQNERLLKTVVLPAYASLGDGLLLLEDADALPAGLAALPEGKAYYQELLISQTGSYRSVEEIRQLLTAQFSREYEAVKKLAAEHPELLQYYTRETAPGFPYREASQMLLDLKQRMAEDFPPIPGGAVDVHVKAVSDSLADYCAPAFYLTAPLDDTASNTIYINRRKTPDGLELYTTLAHEGYPGHLYQTVYHNRSSLAAGERPARELLWYGGYQEGWALYVEFLSYQYAAELLRENGQETAALAAALEARNRSLQLCLYCVCDVLIHYEGASYSQIAKVLSGFGITDSTSMKAIYNYIVQTPCNYLKYYLGYLEILSLQEEAKELWGAEYTDYRFHSFFLDCGPADFASLGQWLAQTG
ncbi:DUF885 domain-containing protein [uncultured Acetatifactor sp.]|uniref:DUF885 domain-containing protein n=1 Tax=uncultured Acetatifactor sp. TaxID=1671927 RepID=UPI0026047B2A|nr:DUF885 domain-containing protein [uncultured Acetatifactor sp.]